MIQLTRLNHAPLVLNSDLIEHMEVTPDTVVTLTTGQKIVVLESAEEVVERIIRFRKSSASSQIRRLRATRCTTGYNNCSSATPLELLPAAWSRPKPAAGNSVRSCIIRYSKLM
jgi:flagellar protein FlbD